MGLVVHKYGGTSVGTVERIQNVAKRIAAAREKGDDIVVVVSAMSGETDRLIKLAHQLAKMPDEREMDMLISTGERVTIALLAMALKEAGVKAKSFTGRQVGILTDSVHMKARIEKISAERIHEALKDGIIPVVAGFQGMDDQSDVTTLGRGGSDTTAVALAAALKADSCIIYTDVDGVYTTDPNICASARKLDRVSYEEMLEFASLGAKVLQTRSVEFAMKYNVPVLVSSSFNNKSGTWVTREDRAMEQVVVSGIAHDKNQSRITLPGVPDKPGVASKIFGEIAHANIVVDMIIQNVSQDGLTDISFTVPRSDLKEAERIVSKIGKDIGAGELQINENIAKVSIVGVGMRSHSGIAAKMFATLATEGINIMMISTSEIKISCVIDAKYTELAVRSLHEAFELGKEPAARS